jgi:uncharacterized protein
LRHSQEAAPARKRSGTERFELKAVRAPLAGVADGVIEGYASLFGKVDQSGDMVAAGAFAASLARRGAAGVRMLYQHAASEPVGIWTQIKEDARGLFVRGRILTEIVRGREVLALLRAGALDGLSIGYRTLRAERAAGQPVRTLLEIDLWEVSIVTFPMLDGARVTGVKAGANANSSTPIKDRDLWTKRQIWK